MALDTVVRTIPTARPRRHSWVVTALVLGAACAEVSVGPEASTTVTDAASDRVTAVIRDASVDRGDCTACFHPIHGTLGCVDLQTDPFHCGGCRYSCTEWDDCRRGRCVERFLRDSGRSPDRSAIDASVIDAQPL